MVAEDDTVNIEKDSAFFLVVVGSYSFDRSGYPLIEEDGARPFDESV